MDADHPLSPGPFPARREELRRQGLSDRQVNRLLAGGRLTPLRRGVHGRADPGYLDLLQAVLLTHGRDLVVSHLSAARVRGLPNPLSGWRRPEFTATTGPPRIRSGVHIRVAPLGPRDVTRYSLLSVTSPARTVLDCARTLPGPDGLAIADAALRARLVTGPELQEALAAQRRWPGVRRARAVLDLADGRRETPLESWSAWGFEREGLPRPEWQIDVLTMEGRFLGRCDSWWDGVAGEADGRSKYRLAAAERGGADAETLFSILDDERRREVRIEQVGIEVVRWDPADVLQPARRAVLASRIRGAIRRRTPGRYRTRRPTA